MELFASAGIDLPPAGGGSRRPKGLGRTLHVPLFNYKVVQEASARGATLFSPTQAQLDAAKDYARKVRDPKFLKQKETAVRGLLIQEVLQSVLGYTPYDPAKPYSLAVELQIGAGIVDAALGSFTADNVEGIAAPFELKGPGTTDLDRMMPGRGRSPVQQAWEYAIDAPGARWVLVSNCVEIRLYAFGRGRDAYERFDLTRLDEPFEHERLWRILGAKNLFGGHTDQLLRDTDNAYRDITNELYKQYKGLRERLIGFLTNGGEGPRLDALKAIEIAQKLLDRVLFIAFAQRTELLPGQLLEKAAKEINTFAPQPLWRNFLGLFRFVDIGSPTNHIPAYNGGLFAQDPLADEIILPDHLAQEVALLGQWDYRRDLPVTVLGHLFEQSITDIEALKAGTAPDVSKRKREGVVYTPDTITRFLVERTVGLTLDERRARLWRDHGMDAAVPDTEREIAFWRAYLAELKDFTIVDPACGSGAFLVAAFDEMARRYRDAVTGLAALGQEIEFDVSDQIVTGNLHGVDLNPESVEITRLSLWLKTARPQHKLQNLEATIKDGNSLIADPVYAERPFDWRAKFPEVFARGGFDVVIGNPPYVRMEYLKAEKPYLAQHYVVADDRTDLYAYFFEKGVEVLKPGGRLGYISSSTFFKTGSGENLRTFLTDHVAVEAVVDFGDVQVFEGVTTYPAILTLKKGEDGEAGDLRFLGVRDRTPEDIGRAFARDGRSMPRARLGKGSWQFEDDALAALRAKITAGRKTLGEVYGAPLYGIKTGLNAAFVVSREVSDRLVAADPKSAELLKPFLRGENFKRWQVESEDLFLINTPRGKVDIEAYPAIRDWLAAFRDSLEKRATKQEWWELQQAQLAFQEQFLAGGIGFPDISQGPKFGQAPSGYLFDCTTFVWPIAEAGMLAYLNSSLSWFILHSLSNPLRGGVWRLRLKAQYVEALPAPEFGLIESRKLAKCAQVCALSASSRHDVVCAVHRRIFDLATSSRHRLSNKLLAWHELDFAAFRAEITKVFRTDIPLKQRGEWETYLAENSAEVHKLTKRIKGEEREINNIINEIFDLTPDEIALLEASITGQY